LVRPKNYLLLIRIRTQFHRLGFFVGWRQLNCHPASSSLNTRFALWATGILKHRGELRLKPRVFDTRFLTNSQFEDLVKQNLFGSIRGLIRILAGTAQEQKSQRNKRQLHSVRSDRGLIVTVRLTTFLERSKDYQLRTT
jgi:hypothetical protein